MTDFIVGSPARDVDFWFRTDFLDLLWDSLGKHNVLMVAPRRIGKTSVMYRMLDDPRKDWLVIHLNVEDLKTPDEFFINLIDAFNEHQPAYLHNVLAKGWDFLGNMMNRIEEIEAFELKLKLRKSGDLKEKWADRLTELMDRIFQNKQKVLIIIDELPDMLNSMSSHAEAEYEKFLHWFRKMRESSLNTSVRWLLGGSVNLVAALDQQGKIKLINDLKVEVLPPFTEEEVKQFVGAMFQAHGVMADDSVIPRILELLGAPIPIFLQLLTQELYRRWKRQSSVPLTADIVTEVFNKALLGEMARDKLQHYRSRIDLHYAQEDREAACHILNKLCLSKDGLSQKNLFSLYRQIEERKAGARKGPALNQAFQRLLLYLQSDFYIEEKITGSYDFASRLLKTWWKKYCGYEYGGV